MKINSIIKKFNSYLISLQKKDVHCNGALIGKGCNFEGKNKINKNTVLSNVTVGKGTYIGSECEFLNCKIGKFCSIANDVKIVFGIHPSKKFVSTHPAFFSIRKQAGFTYVKDSIFNENKQLNDGSSIYIGNDVWIGEGVRIMEGIKIGDGAIIGSYALVTKNIEPYSICCGVPAKHIRYRFNNEEIEFLNKLKWWNKGEKWIEDNCIYFNDIKKLKNYMNKRNCR